MIDMSNSKEGVEVNDIYIGNTEEEQVIQHSLAIWISSKKPKERLLPYEGIHYVEKLETNEREGRVERSSLQRGLVNI
jgi:hypothetical protein